MGSGKLIKRAIQKHGIENFTKEILFVFDNEQEMNEKEKELVQISESSYNLCPGGHGGFGYINTNKLSPQHIMTSEKARKMAAVTNSKPLEERKEIAKRAANTRKRNGTQYIGDASVLNTPEAIKKRTETFKKTGHQQGNKNSQYGKPRSEEVKRKISETLKRKRYADVV